MSARATLLALCGFAAGAGGITQGLFWRNTLARADDARAGGKLEEARKEIDLLKRENEALRSLAQGGGEVGVPPEVIHAVETELGLRFQSTPKLHLLSPDDLHGRAEAAVESSFGSSGADDRQEAWRLMGLLGPDSSLVTQFAAGIVARSPGWFDEANGEGWLKKGYDAEAIPNQAELRRLLARILLHQHFPPPAEYPGDEASRARVALHEGLAQGVKEKFLAGHALQGFLGMKENEDARLVLASLSPFVRELVLFPVAAGRGYADLLHRQGADAVKTALAKPPAQTCVILGSPPAAPPTLPETTEAPYLTESAGALGLQAWLGKPAPGTVADRYALVPDGDSSYSLVWDFTFAEAGQADAFAALARGRIAKLPAEGRHVSITRVEPTRVRILNAATKAFADSLAGDQSERK